MEAMAILLLVCALGWARARSRQGDEERFLRRERWLGLNGASWNHPAQPWPRG